MKHIGPKIFDLFIFKTNFYLYTGLCFCELKHTLLKYFAKNGLKLEKNVPVSLLTPQPQLRPDDPLDFRLGLLFKPLA